MKDNLLKIACFVALCLFVVAAIGCTWICFSYNLLFGVASLMLVACSAPTAIKLFNFLVNDVSLKSE